MAAVIICCQASTRHTVMSQFWELSRDLHCADVAGALLLLPYAPRMCSICMFPTYKLH